MNLMTKVREAAESAATEARSRVEQLRQGRERTALLTELGELTYRRHRGDPIDETAIDPVLAELDRLTMPDAAAENTAAEDAATHADEHADE